MSPLKRIVRNPYLYIILISYYGVWLLWDAIKLPYREHTGIISFLPQIGYNPNNNIVRFLLAVLVPPLACLALWLLLNTSLKTRIAQLRATRYALPGILVTGCLLLCVGMGVVQNSTNPANNPPAYGEPYDHALVDTFHEGETLGPAISYEHKDLKPYRDFVVVHGVFQDPLRTVIAFKLFGKSIGASRAFAVVLGIAAFVLYFALLAVLFRGHLVKAATGLWILAVLMLPTATLPLVGSYIFGVQFPFRDFATILFLIAAVVGLRAVQAHETNPRKLKAASLTVGFIAIAGFANSIDRALFIAALSVVWLVLVYLTASAKSFAKTVLLPFGIGALIGVPVLGLALKWAFIDFFVYLVTISRYKEYLDGVVFVKPNVAVSIVLLTVAALITVTGAALLRTLRQPVTKRVAFKAKLHAARVALEPLVREHAVTLLLLATALFFLRSAMGRALPDHFIYSVQWLYLLLVYVGLNRIYKSAPKRRTIFSFASILMLGVVLAYYAVRVRHIDLARDTFPIHVSDDKFMRTDYVETARYLKDNLSGNETFVTLTSEAAWYYFADTPSPTKYPVIWYAFTHPERQKIADDLARNKNIKYIVLNNNWTTNFDYVPNETRFPEVYSVLKEQFVPYAGFGQQTVWARK